jgi:hypothetical protein
MPVLHQDMPQIGQLIRLAGLKFWQSLLSLRAAGAVKPRKIAKYEDDLAAMSFEDARITLRDNEVGELRRGPSAIGAGCGKTSEFTEDQVGLDFRSSVKPSQPPPAGDAPQP